LSSRGDGSQSYNVVGLSTLPFNVVSLWLRVDMRSPKVALAPPHHGRHHGVLRTRPLRHAVVTAATGENAKAVGRFLPDPGTLLSTILPGIVFCGYFALPLRNCCDSREINKNVSAFVLDFSPLYLAYAPAERHHAQESEGLMFFPRSAATPGVCAARNLHRLVPQLGTRVKVKVKVITMNTISTRSGVMQDSAFVVNLDGQNVTNTASNSGLGNRSSATKPVCCPPRFGPLTNRP
jgi:hypothetical protein